MTLDTTKFYNVIPVWMILTSSQGYKKSRSCAIILLLKAQLQAPGNKPAQGKVL